jgi:TetR/AcrR family transcriptional regulator, lmrAB and yxaGH operons repressor
MSQKRQRRVDGDSSRDAFIEATGTLLRRQGYNATGVNAIVAASGAPKGSLYFHFPGGKEELAVAAMEREGDRLRRAIAAVVSSGEGSGEAIAGLIDALAQGLERSGFKDGCPIATVTLEAATQSEALRATSAAVFESWLEVLEARLLAGGLDATGAHRRALLVLAAIEGALIMARARRELQPLNAVREELIGLLG